MASLQEIINNVYERQDNQNIRMNILFHWNIFLTIVVVALLFKVL